MSYLRASLKFTLKAALTLLFLVYLSYWSVILLAAIAIVLI